MRWCPARILNRSGNNGKLWGMESKAKKSWDGEIAENNRVENVIILETNRKSNKYFINLKKGKSYTLR